MGETRVLGAVYCGGARHNEHEWRPADPADVEVALRWVEHGRQVSVIRAHGRTVHPYCGEFARTGTCPHVRRAIALAERPLETFAEDVVTTWGEWGMHNVSEWAAQVRREAEGALQRQQALVRHANRPASDRVVEDFVRVFTRPGG